ncbi:uncharacterized protein EDB91DRAFT_1143913, partial [Suillus paluster]|uniref:uncharacterized protein n=1 Tax=Suillus paluster TaxID=48578 RepID=UPI001B87C5B0
MIVDVLDHKKWWASIPISASLAACAMCGYDHDWYCFAMILLGIISNGLTCLVVGSASVVLEGVKPADNAPPGDGMLVDDSSNHIVILKGAEEDVNGITKGRVYLEYLPRVWMKKRSPGLPREPSGATPDLEQAPEEKGRQNGALDFGALLLGMQSLLQLLLIPQGTLFGQLMFLSSFVISWVYNLYLSSLDKEKIQQELLFKTLNVDVGSMSRFELGTRTTAAVFATLVLRPPSPIKLLNCFLPNKTAVWNRWREHVGGYINAEGVGMELKPLESCNDAGFTEEEKSLLKQLLDDAKEAIRGYNEKFLKKSSDSVSPFGTLSQRHGSSERLLSPTRSPSTRGSAFNQPA